MPGRYRAIVGGAVASVASQTTTLQRERPRHPVSARAKYLNRYSGALRLSTTPSDGAATKEGATFDEHT